MKKIISGKELKLNDGGESDIFCPNNCAPLRKHISGHKRYFCVYCGWKGVMKKTKEYNFIRVKPARIGWTNMIKSLE
jgi:hypothetical protein